MSKFSFFVLLAFTPFFNWAQLNLAPNGGFETTVNCPDYPGEINYAANWNNVNLVYGSFTVGTPDFFHACGSASLGYNCVPPNTFAGNCNPHAGNGYGGTVLYNTPYPEYREYMATTLTDVMRPGTTYTVSFWITNGAPPISPYTIKNIGVNFSASPLTQSGWSPIYITPTWENTNYSGSQTWTQYTFTLNPTAIWQYMTLGSFRNDAANMPVSTYTGTAGPPSAYAYYFWDDIQVLAPSITGISEFGVKTSPLNIYPNPAKEVINISSSEQIDEVVIHNYTGEIAKRAVTLNNTCQIDTKDMERGIYYISILSKGRIIISKKIMLE